MLMEEDRFMVCCLDTVEECNDYGHPFNTDGWTGVRVAEMVRGNTHHKYRYLTMLTSLYYQLQVSPTTLSLDTSLACGGGPYSGLGYLWLETPCGGEYLNTISKQYLHNIYTRRGCVSSLLS